MCRPLLCHHKIQANEPHARNAACDLIAAATSVARVVPASVDAATSVARVVPASVDLEGVEVVAATALVARVVDLEGVEVVAATAQNVLTFTQMPAFPIPAPITQRGCSLLFCSCQASPFLLNHVNRHSAFVFAIFIAKAQCSCLLCRVKFFPRYFVCVWATRIIVPFLLGPAQQGCSFFF